MSTFKWFLLALLARGSIVLALPIFFIQVGYRYFSKKYDNKYYFIAIAVGADADLGSILYGSKRHTISAKCGEHSYFKNRKFHKIHKYFLQPFIDFFFGKRHCYLQAIEENLILEEEE